MELTQAVKLDKTLNPRRAKDLSTVLAMTARARRMLLSEQAGRKGPCPTDQGLIRALRKDEVAWDPRIKQLIATRSTMSVDQSIRPLDHSQSFDSVEQCMEFVIRYFRTEMAKLGRPDGSFGQDFAYQHDIAAEVSALAMGQSRIKGYSAFLNGGTVPPRAGDVLSLNASDGEFHVALITKVDQDHDGKWFVRVFEANVPYNVNDPDIRNHYEDLPLVLENGTFKVLPANTSDKGYQMDMDIVGWIHPQGEKALPGAAAEEQRPKCVHRPAPGKHQPKQAGGK